MQILFKNQTHAEELIYNQESGVAQEIYSPLTRLG